MKIGIIGLGLIGGSFCKAIKAKTDYICMGMDKNPDVLRKAINDGVIDGELTKETLKDCDIVIVSLYPKATVSFLNENAKNFNKNGIVTDVCGIKSYVIKETEKALKENGVTFIGAHPMAGREFSGFDYSLPDLFEGASFIMTPDKDTDNEKIDALRKLAEKLGFSKIVKTDVKTHDETIAFTSQVAHVISNAYVKSPALQNESGFSAGSFQDLSRVAKLNEDMWTDLFLLNKEPLLNEIDIIINHLSEYRKALSEENAKELKTLLRDGRILKEKG